MNTLVTTFAKVVHSERLWQLGRFCIVGGSGVFVDMGVLAILADPRCLGLNVAFSKVCAAEAAMISNFFWNELWTFRSVASARPYLGSRWRRLLMFNAICGIGIVLAVLLLEFFHVVLNWNLYLSNLMAIVVVTAWNFGMNARFNWRKASP